MKKIIYVLSGMFLLISCTDILEEHPKAIATQTFYNTADEIESAVYSIYDPIRHTNCLGGNYWAQMEAQTDYGTGRGSYAMVTQFQGIDATNVGRVGSSWQKFYHSIRNANLVIKNAPNAISVAQATLNMLIGEAKFLRAFCYFHLARNWGDVPLRVEGNMLDEKLARTPTATIYNLIISDLEFAEMYLPDAAKMPGRATKWAAKALLADVHLQLQNWNDARDLSLEVINSGQYSLVDVSTSDDFYNIFGPNIISSTEEIFYLKYNSTSGSNFVHYAHHPGTPYDKGAGWYALYTDSIENKVIKNWDYKDLRKYFNLYSYNISLGATTVLYKKFIDPDRAGGSSVDYPCYRLADILLLYAESDCQANNGPTPDGIEKLNMVHRRAYGKDPDTASSVDFKLADYTKDSFIDLVMKERMYETFFEGKRWLDLKRTEKVKSTMKEAYGIDVAQKHLWWPIPNSEYEYNEAIDPETDQNPGY
uniref:RagB/SusD family nutrient uptake outer membrane protein n=1 Tax=uncultured Draconibacterium sp. TaxID=1573823 RepID=UPI003217E286